MCFVQSKSTLSGLPKEYTKNQWLSFFYNIVPEQCNTNIRVCALCSAFYGGLFLEPGRVAVHTIKWGNSNFARKVWCL